MRRPRPSPARAELARPHRSRAQSRPPSRPPVRDPARQSARPSARPRLDTALDPALDTALDPALGTTQAEADAGPTQGIDVDRGGRREGPRTAAPAAPARLVLRVDHRRLRQAPRPRASRASRRSARSPRPARSTSAPGTALVEMTRQPDQRRAAQPPGRRARDHEAGLERRPGAGSAGPAEADRLVLRNGHRHATARRPRSSVRGFQAKRQIPVTGEVDQRTLDRLPGDDPHADQRRAAQQDPEAVGGSGLDSRCLTGRAMCISKRTNSLVWVVDGKAAAADGRALRVRRDADPRGLVLGGLEVPEPRLDDLPHPDAVRDVLQRRPGRALLARLRRPRLQRRLPRLRQRPQPRAASSWLFDQVRVGDKVIVYR